MVGPVMDPHPVGMEPVLCEAEAGSTSDRRVAGSLGMGNPAGSRSASTAGLGARHGGESSLMEGGGGRRGGS